MTTAGRSLTLTIFGEDKSASKTLAKVGDDAESMASRLGTAAKVVGGLAIGKFFVDAAGAASDLVESTNTVTATFGDAASKIETFGSGAAESLAMSNLEARNAAVTFGTFGKAAGLSGNDLADFSTELTGLGADMASFKNTSPEQAIEAIGAALRGESEPIRAYGVLLDDATLKNRAMAMGLIATTKEALTPQQKVLAAHQEILAQTTTMQGDVARSAGTMAQEQRRAAAEFENVKAEIGEGLIPIGTKLFQLFGDVGVPALQATGNVLGVVFSAVTPVITVVGDLATVVTALPAPLMTAITALGGIALMKGPLDKAWTSIKNGAETAALTIMVAGEKSAGAGKGFAIAGAGARALGSGLKAAFMSNPIGLAIVGITTAISLFSDKTDEATADAGRFTDVIDEQTGALKANARELTAKRLADDGSLQKAKEAGISADLYTEAVLGNVDAVAEIKRRLDEANTAFDAAMQKNREATMVSGEYAVALTDTLPPVYQLREASQQLGIDQGNLKSSQDKVILGLEGSGKAADVTAGKLGALSTASDTGKHKTEDLSLAVQDEKKAHEELNTAVENVIAALDTYQHRNDPKPTIDAAKAVRDYAGAIRDHDAAARGVADAQARVIDAENKLTDARKKSTDSNYSAAEKTRDIAQAERDLAAAHDGVSEANDRVAEANDRVTLSGEDARKKVVEQALAARDAAISNGNAAGAYDAARAKIDEMKTSLYNAALQSTGSKIEADKYLASLNLIPDEVISNIIAEDKATGKIDAVNTALDEINNRQVRVTVLAGLVAQGNDALSSYYGWGGGSYTSSYTGRAEGGLAIGGRRGRDSIPTMLMPGELVLTTGEVQRNGGAAGVYSTLDGGGRNSRRLEQAVAGLAEKVANQRPAVHIENLNTQARSAVEVAEEVLWLTRRSG